MHTLVRAAICASCASLLSGCAIIQIEGEARASVVKFGVLRIEPKQASGALVYRTRGIGIIPREHGLTFGWADETVARVPVDGCRIVLVQPKPEDVDAILKTLAAASVTPETVCVIER